MVTLASGDVAYVDANGRQVDPSVVMQDVIQEAIPQTEGEEEIPVPATITVTPTETIALDESSLSEGGLVLTTPIASAKAEVTELLLTPVPNGIKLEESTEEKKHTMETAEAEVTTLTITPTTTQFPAEHVLSIENGNGTVTNLVITATSYTPEIGAEAIQSNTATLNVDAKAATGTITLQTYKVSTLDSAGNVTNSITVHGVAELTATVIGLTPDATGTYYIDGIKGKAIIETDFTNAELALTTLFNTWNNKEILFNVDVPVSQTDIDMVRGLADAIAYLGEKDDDANLSALAKDMRSAANAASTLSTASSSVAGTVSTLANLNLSQIASFLASMASNGKILVELDFSNFAGLEDMASYVESQIQAIIDDLNSIDGSTKTVYINEVRNGGGGGGDTTSTNTTNFNVNINSGAAQAQLNAVSAAMTRLSGLSTTSAAALNNLVNKLTALKNAISGLPDKSRAVNNTANAMNRLKSKNISVNVSGTATMRVTTTVTVNVNATSSGNATATVSAGSKRQDVRDTTEKSKPVGENKAKGNVALAKGTGPALAKGRTLMGELGPELVVAGGRYYTVGNEGAEFVDLPEDAIVFNHLQTEKLLGSGGMVGTGEPVTNERKAVAFASGNVSGPAMASASDALAELYKLRAMW